VHEECICPVKLVLVKVFKANMYSPVLIKANCVMNIPLISLSPLFG